MKLSRKSENAGMYAEIFVWCRLTAHWIWPSIQCQWNNTTQQYSFGIFFKFARHTFLAQRSNFSVQRNRRSPEIQKWAKVDDVNVYSYAHGLYGYSRVRKATGRPPEIETFASVRWLIVPNLVAVRICLGPKLVAVGLAPCMRMFGN